MAEGIAWIDSEMPLLDLLDGFNLTSSLIVIKLPSTPNY